MPIINYDKKHRIKTNILATIESRFGGEAFLGNKFNKVNRWKLDDENGVFQEKMDNLFDYMKMSNCWWDNQLTIKSLCANKTMIKRMWSFILCSGNLTQSLYKDKILDGVKSGKYVLVKDILVLWKIIRDIGNKAKALEHNVESVGEMLDGQQQDIDELNEEIILLKKKNKHLEETYEKKTGEKCPEPPEPETCCVCAEEMIDEKAHKNLSCCNNKLCKKCIIKVIGQGGRCPYCRQDMLGKIVEEMGWDTLDGIQEIQEIQ